MCRQPSSHAHAVQPFTAECILVQNEWEWIYVPSQSITAQVFRHCNSPVTEVYFQSDTLPVQTFLPQRRANSQPDKAIQTTLLSLLPTSCCCILHCLPSQKLAALGPGSPGSAAQTSAMVTSTSTPGSMLHQPKQRRQQQRLSRVSDAVGEMIKAGLDCRRQPCSWQPSRSTLSAAHICCKCHGEQSSHLMDAICFTTSAGECRSMSLL